MNSNYFSEKHQNLMIKIDQYDWQNHEFIKSLIFESIKIQLNKKEHPKIGESKIGGTPDFPSAMTWPIFEEKPMIFFAQLNLSEIANFQSNEILPNQGILYFFGYFPEPENEYGVEFDYERPKSKYKVLFYDGDISTLQSVKFPKELPSIYEFKTSKIDLETYYEIPIVNEIEYLVEDFDGLTEKDEELYEEYTDEHNWNPIEYQILGTPPPVQHSVFEEWGTVYVKQEELDIDENEISKDFVNLLSMPIFDVIGDCHIYFGILKDDLLAKRFDKTVFIIQGL
ncbi:YwqG family protein [Flavivirga amylovorans]|uniref:YwqG family protein n=1 Tax=Flavivirga amylovorans TaxID=870486 RepID=A0ABT8X2B9_9FLAO|nr:YwqG family protein [Flavivirga amylovorans]MDO5988097.1 YwqG family protein [Flavivirga amylovorans]